MVIETAGRILEWKMTTSCAGIQQTDGKWIMLCVFSCWLTFLGDMCLYGMFYLQGQRASRCSFFLYHDLLQNYEAKTENHPLQTADSGEHWQLSSIGERKREAPDTSSVHQTAHHALVPLATGPPPLESPLIGRK